MIFHCWYDMRSIRKNTRLLCWIGMAGEPNLGQGLETIPSLTAIWFSHYKRLITPILSNHCEMTKEISQYEDHLSRSFSSKPQKNYLKSLTKEWVLLKKTYPWRQESRVNLTGTAGHSIPRYYKHMKREQHYHLKYQQGWKS